MTVNWMKVQGERQWHLPDDFTLHYTQGPDGKPDLARLRGAVATRCGLRLKRAEGFSTMVGRREQCFRCKEAAREAGLDV